MVKELVAFWPKLKDTGSSNEVPLIKKYSDTFVQWLSKHPDSHILLMVLKVTMDSIIGQEYLVLKFMDDCIQIYFQGMILV
jgi:hypothetical protein